MIVRSEYLGDRHSRTALQNYLSTLIEAQAVPIMSHAKLSGILGPEGMAKIPMPMAKLIEIEPPSFIAVRERRDPQENLRRATDRGQLKFTISRASAARPDTSLEPASMRVRSRR